MLPGNGEVAAVGWHSRAYQQGASLHPPAIAVSWASTYYTYYLLLIYKRICFSGETFTSFIDNT